MKKVGDIMKEMGFNKEAPDSVKEAFIKNLIKSATGVTVETPSEKAAARSLSKATDMKPAQQLSFDFTSNKNTHQKVS